MGELILISGANGSGKSACAEALIGRIAPTAPRFYLATMRVQTEENRRRVEKHRRQRAGLGFQTLERPLRVADAPVSADGVVLLEDVSNLLANAIFEENRTEQSVLQDILALTRRCRLLVAVTISGLCAEGFDAETGGYIRALNHLNQTLFEAAAAAAAIRGGVPEIQKGDLHELIQSASCGAVHLQRDPGSAI